MSAVSTPLNLASKPAPAWGGDYVLLARNLILKDFRVRYRNMSLGVFWSLLNPLVMMGVLWFVFTKIMPNGIADFPLVLLTGIVPYNVFTISWIGGTTSLVDSASLIKRVPVPREVIPVAAVLANCLQLSAQVALMLLLVVAVKGVNVYWLWLAPIWTLYVLFVIGLSLMFSALNVYIRDIRYVVESANVILFWMVPIFYPFSIIPAKYVEIYKLNPVAALVMASRNILLDGVAPAGSLLLRLAASSILVLVMGILVFRKLKPRFYNYL